MPETEIKAGSIVRSFDFDCRDLHGERACYVIGRVKGIGNYQFPHKVYEIEAIAIIFGGEIQDHTEDGGVIIYPPVNGLRKMRGGETNNVELV